MAAGVIKILEKPYYTSEDVQEILGVGRSKSYRIINNLRKELITSGKLCDDYPAGKIPKKYFNTRCML